MCWEEIKIHNYPPDDEYEQAYQQHGVCFSGAVGIFSALIRHQQPDGTEGIQDHGRDAFTYKLLIECLWVVRDNSSSTDESYYRLLYDVVYPSSE